MDTPSSQRTVGYSVVTAVRLEPFHTFPLQRVPQVTEELVKRGALGPSTHGVRRELPRDRLVVVTHPTELHRFLVGQFHNDVRLHRGNSNSRDVHSVFLHG